MLSTRMTDMLHIRHPIMQGGLHNLGVPELAAAVSEAGGLGTINAAQYDTPEAFRTAVQRLRRMACPVASRFQCQPCFAAYVPVLAAAPDGAQAL